MICCNFAHIIHHLANCVQKCYNILNLWCFTKVKVFRAAMEDFMDNLVKEVEGNVKPIRSVKMEDFDDVQSDNPIPADPKPTFRKVDWSVYKNTPAQTPVTNPPVNENPQVSAPRSVSAQEAKASKSDDRDIFLHVHQENVRCYRNTQAVINENSDQIKQELKNTRSGLRGWLIFLFILTILNLGANAFLILRMVFGII